jgi:hypothetical protein
MEIASSGIEEFWNWGIEGFANETTGDHPPTHEATVG